MIIEVIVCNIKIFIYNVYYKSSPSAVWKQKIIRIHIRRRGWTEGESIKQNRNNDINNYNNNDTTSILYTPWRIIEVLYDIGTFIIF